ncbi:polysaccharide deacetylase [Paenibacillus sp. NAIST15-1]|uniref:polysaccharide deacetylase n=1 Tax=Paenibacillus sp. NAIST15-1 TaxID=1605994 RepID=UPI000868BC7F|nr:polysaccharide deacetylase [Paenibacillus sp. NAIST15-1]GAV14259.1 polysaccharide deacetylase [Paenibacillus sp. NAIST15-1]
MMNDKLKSVMITALCALLVLIGTLTFVDGQTPTEHIAYASSGHEVDRHESSSHTLVGVGDQTSVLSAAVSSLIAGQQVGVEPAAALVLVSSKSKSEVPANKPDKVVYLTFDDGPSVHTKEVLDILQQEKVKGTFFVLGQQAERNPKLVERIVNEGHALGNHSYNHDYSELYSDFRKFWSQIKRTGEVIKKIVGYEPELVRAPGGTFLNFDKQYFDLMNQAGYLVYDWHVDSNDSKRRGVPAKEIVQGVKDGALLPSTVVLMHDGVGHGETVKALPEIIRYYKTKGYTFDVLSSYVKPVQFKLAAKQRWSRTSVSKAWIEANVKPIQTVSNDKAQKPGQKPDQKPDTTAGGTPDPKTNQKPAEPVKLDRQLTIATEQGELEFAPDQFMSYQDLTYVPLRMLVERLNGTVKWNTELERVDIEWNNSLVGIDVRAGKMELIGQSGEDGEVKVQPLRIVTEKYVTWVPLRQVLDAFGVKMTSYMLSPLKPIEKQE